MVDTCIPRLKKLSNSFNVMRELLGGDVLPPLLFKAMVGQYFVYCFIFSSPVCNQGKRKHNPEGELWRHRELARAKVGAFGFVGSLRIEHAWEVADNIQPQSVSVNPLSRKNCIFTYFDS